MIGQVAFRRQQRGVALSMAAAFLVTLIAWAGAFHRAQAELDEPWTERIATMVRADVFVLLWLALAIANVARLRLRSPLDIGGSATGTDTEPVVRARAILQNTLEQTALAVPVHLALGAPTGVSVAAAPTLAWLFAVGRISFWMGYRHGPLGRAFGFALTFYPTVGGLIVCLAAAFGR